MPRTPPRSIRRTTNQQCELGLLVPTPPAHRGNGRPCRPYPSASPATEKGQTLDGREERHENVARSGRCPLSIAQRRQRYGEIKEAHPPLPQKHALGNLQP